jgi:hypothetical protein
LRHIYGDVRKSERVGQTDAGQIIITTGWGIFTQILLNLERVNMESVVFGRAVVYLTQIGRSYSPSSCPPALRTQHDINK